MHVKLFMNIYKEHLSITKISSYINSLILKLLKCPNFGKL